MLEVVTASAFKRDVKKLHGKDMEKLKKVIRLLANADPLPQTYKDHALIGQWKSYRDAHIEPDWILIYRTNEQSLYLARTGSHAELFGK